MQFQMNSQPARQDGLYKMDSFRNTSLTHPPPPPPPPALCLHTPSGMLLTSLPSTHTFLTPQRPNCIVCVSVTSALTEGQWDVKAGNKTSKNIPGILKVSPFRRCINRKTGEWSMECAGGGWVGGVPWVSLRVHFRSPRQGSRVEEEAGFSFYLFCELYIGFCFPLC